ncbi:MAG: PhoH family protein [Bacteriovoracaceae bacterium]|nr:PhoH family protein [Bacteriovoracaceae bacterium]
MKKTFVIDTNVLLLDPHSIYKFGEHTVFIPFIVLEELDKFKKDQNENGRNARYFARLVDQHRTKGSLAAGIKMDNGGTLQMSVLHPDPKVLPNIDLKVNDNSILMACLILKKQGKQVVFITKDINLRLKSDALEIESEDFETSDLTFDELYSGQREVTVSQAIMQKFEEDKFVPISDLGIKDILPNEYVHLHLEEVETTNHSATKKLGRYSKAKGGVVPLIRKRDGVWGIYPRNVEQQFALDALLNEEISLVCLVGKAGTGKTLLAIAAGLEATINRQIYTRVLVSRPIIPMGRDLGFLPGDVNEKLGPWMQPIFDNIDFLFGNRRGERNAVSWEELINQGLLHIEPLTYIRGRSLPAQYMIVDEAQNLSPHEVKTIITRAGEGTKIILTGDCEQIDSPYLDSINNGLAYCIDRLKDEEIVSHAVLKVGERSPLSEIASKKL